MPLKRLLYTLWTLQLLMLSVADATAEIATTENRLSTFRNTTEEASTLWFCAVAAHNDLNADETAKSHRTLFQKKEQQGIQVYQGNANAKSLVLGDKNYLYTHHLNPCIAIIIVDRKNHRCHLIHCDVLGVSSIGKSSLETTLRKLGLSEGKSCEISLIGGATSDSLRLLENKIKCYLPKSKIVLKEPTRHDVYLAGDGRVAFSRNELEQGRKSSSNRP